MFDAAIFNFREPQLMMTGLLMRTQMKQGKVDKDTGEIPEKLELQLLCNIWDAKTDTVRSDMVNLGMKDEGLYKTYENLLGKVIRVPVGCFTPKNGGLIYWALAGAKPEEVRLSVPQPVSKAA